MQPLVIGIRFSPGKGRCVIAKSNFREGELIERAPVLVVPAAQQPLIDQTDLFNYYFGWANGGADDPENLAIPLVGDDFSNIHDLATNKPIDRRREMLPAHFRVRLHSEVPSAALDHPP